MTINIVQIDRHRFVCGLFWQSLSRRHELRAEAIGLAKKLNFDAMVLRIDRSFAGAGFASTREGVQLGLPSLGALVSKVIATEGAFYDGRQQPAPNWLGAFALPDGRWVYFAVRDGAFLPHGDWVGSGDEVLDRLHSDYSLGGWNVVIGDTSLEAQGFHNFYPRQLAEMIPKRHGKPHVPRWLRLVPVTRRLPWRRALPAAGALACVATLAIGWPLYRRHEAAARELALQHAREQLALQRGRASVKTPAPVHPWAAAPAPDTLIDACLTRFTLLAPAGWQLEHYTCASAAADYSWSRNGSTVALLLGSLPNAQIDPSGEHASLTMPLAMPAGGDEPLAPHARTRMQLLSAFQTLGIPLTLTLQAPAVRVQPADGTPLLHLTGAPAQAPIPDWHIWHFSSNLGEMSPRNVAAYLHASGVRIDKLSYRSGQWSVEGVIYER